jgi:hypothetical protein
MAVELAWIVRCDVCRLSAESGLTLEDAVSFVRQAGGEVEVTAGGVPERVMCWSCVARGQEVQ